MAVDLPIGIIYNFCLSSTILVNHHQLEQFNYNLTSHSYGIQIKNVFFCLYSFITFMSFCFDGIINLSITLH
jgi:hypothetical protein